MSARKRCGMGVVAGLLLLASVGGESAVAEPQNCNARLTVALTPDVPRADDTGFLSSLLNDHPAYRLEFLKQIDPSSIEVDLSGPGPAVLCRDVVEDMRRDRRVLSIRVDSAESSSPLTARPELLGVPVSSSGIGSLYWAAHHPGGAWKLLLPIRSSSGGAD